MLRLTTFSATPASPETRMGVSCTSPWLLSRAMMYPPGRTASPSNDRNDVGWPAHVDSGSLQASHLEHQQRLQATDSGNNQELHPCGRRQPTVTDPWSAANLKAPRSSSSTVLTLPPKVNSLQSSRMKLKPPQPEGCQSTNVLLDLGATSTYLSLLSATTPAKVSGNNTILPPRMNMRKNPC
jgi:hypothetical protein